MTTPKLHLVTHMGHDGPWLLIKTAKEIRERREYIRTNKPEHERALRLRLLKVVKAPLPPQLVKARAAWIKAYAARDQAYAARDQAYAAWFNSFAALVKADAARATAHAAWAKADAAWVKANVALVKAYAAWFKAHAAWVKATAAWDKANAAWDKADAAWAKAINSSAGVKFHAQVCGCAWTPKQPDILRQLPQYQKEN